MKFEVAGSSLALETSNSTLHTALHALTGVPRTGAMSVAQLCHSQELAVFGEGSVAEVEFLSVVPEDRGGVVEAVPFDLSSQVGPARPAAPADVVLSVVPPQGEPVEGRTGLVFHAQDAFGVQELFDLPSIAYGDPFHGSILHDQTAHSCLR